MNELIRELISWGFIITLVISILAGIVRGIKKAFEGYLKEADEAAQKDPGVPSASSPQPSWRESTNRPVPQSKPRPQFASQLDSSYLNKAYPDKDKGVLASSASQRSSWMGSSMPSLRIAEDIRRSEPDESSHSGGFVGDYLFNPDILHQAFVLREVVGPPRAFKPYGQE